MPTEYLPIIASIIVAVITAYGSYRVGGLKTRIDAKALVTNAGDALRDDLLAALDRYEARERFLIGRLDQYEKTTQDLQRTIADLTTQILDLRIENKQLKIDLEKTIAELELFNRKVYYKPKDTTGDITHNG